MTSVPSQEFLRRLDSFSCFLGPHQSEWERQLFSAVSVLARVGLRGTRRRLPGNNDGYREEYARGPGRGWFVLG